MKQCTVCKQVLAASNFYNDKTRKDGLYPSCRKCAAASKKRSVTKLKTVDSKAFSERAKSYKARYRAKHPERVKQQERKTGLKKRFNLNLDVYDAILQVQGGVCAICKKHDGKTLHVDHDHRTGSVRGLLCARCNTGLGLFKDNIPTLQQAITYLKVSNEVDLYVGHCRKRG